MGIQEDKVGGQQEGGKGWKGKTYNSEGLKYDS